jgi:type IV pilus assembly protein PilB
MDENKTDVNLATYKVDDFLIEIIPEHIVKKYEVFPVLKRKNSLTIASFTPENIEIKDQLEQELGISIELIKADVNDIKNAIENYYGKTEISSILSKIKLSKSIIDAEKELEKNIIQITEEKDDDDYSFMRLFNFLMNEALLTQSSDVHIEPLLDYSLIRVRVDGVLQELHKIPKKYHKNLISVIKVKAGIDITETRLPQDGQIEMTWNHQDIDLRVTTMPTILGEKITLRILNKGMLAIPLEQLGFSEKTLKQLTSIISMPTGMILITGPTGSGKTTTLFAFLEQMKGMARNIVTVEDPVEYRMPLINQIEVKPKAGLSFPYACRSLLRQDPDVILLGEIRDPETAKMSMQAALAGTILLSTLHSNDAVGTVGRLRILGVDSYWIASVINCVIAQRLVRKICPHCRTSYSPDSEVIKRLGLDKKKLKFTKGKGCNACHNTGYLGRICISELLQFTQEIKNAIFNDDSPSNIYKTAVESGFSPFIEDVRAKITAGVTTPEECLRVLNIK